MINFFAFLGIIFLISLVLFFIFIGYCAYEFGKQDEYLGSDEHEHF